MTVRVRVDGTDRVFEAKPGDDLLEVFQSNGEPIATSCGGVASCGLCRISIVSGAGALVPIKAHELVHLGNVAKVVGLRLACQAQALPTDGEVVVRIPEVDDVELRKRKKAERSRHDLRSSASQSGAASRSSPASQRPPAPSLGAGRIEWRPGRKTTSQNEDEGKGGT